MKMKASLTWFNQCRYNKPSSFSSARWDNHEIWTQNSCPNSCQSSSEKALFAQAEIRTDQSHLLQNYLNHHSIQNPLVKHKVSTILLCIRIWPNLVANCENLNKMSPTLRPLLRSTGSKMVSQATLLMSSWNTIRCSPKEAYMEGLIKIECRHQINSIVNRVWR